MKWLRNKNNFFLLIGRLWRHLERRRRRQFLLLLILMLVSAFVEVATLGAVLPFLAVLADPEVIFKYAIARTLGSWVGISSGNQMVLPLTLLFIGMALVSGGVRLLLLWFSSRLSHLVGVDLGFNVYLRTLYQPYRVHLMRNSSIIINGVMQKVDNSIHALTWVLHMVISGLLIVTIGVALFVINPWAALIVGAVFGTLYTGFGLAFHRLLINNGKIIARNSTQLIQCVQEGVGGIRDVLLDGCQSVYGKKYREINLPFQLAIAKNQVLSGSLQYIMEAIGMVLIALLAYTLNQQSGGISEVFPMLGAMALAAQRLLPNIQRFYGSWAGIVGGQAALKDTLDLLDQDFPENALQLVSEPLRFECDIQFDNITFFYEEKSSWVLCDICLEVSKGDKIGIVGSTGSGKSTLIDILMGLLDPISGHVLVDGKRVHGRLLKHWQRNIAHVPQSVFLSDGTVAENIAFGIPRHLIDIGQVKSAARQAHLATYIDSLELGYETMVGERGVRLSGGQRQRIGIARALYKQASVIVFDEATSALDNLTERMVMEAIEALDSNLTVFIVAHRLTTVQYCDKIVVLDKGSLVACGSYSELIESCDSFRAMANVSDSK